MHEPPSSNRSFWFIALLYITVIKNDSVIKKWHHHTLAFHIKITCGYIRPNSTVTKDILKEFLLLPQRQWQGVVLKREQNQAGIKFFNPGQYFPKTRGIGTHRTGHCQLGFAFFFQIIFTQEGVYWERCHNKQQSTCHALRLKSSPTRH